jgi:hypothetical protein
MRSLQMPWVVNRHKHKYPKRALQLLQPREPHRVTSRLSALTQAAPNGSLAQSTCNGMRSIINLEALRVTYVVPTSNGLIY